MKIRFERISAVIKNHQIQSAHCLLLQNMYSFKSRPFLYACQIAAIITKRVEVVDFPVIMAEWCFSGLLHRLTKKRGGYVQLHTVQSRQAQFLS